MGAEDDGIRFRQLSPEDATFETADHGQGVLVKTTGETSDIRLQTDGRWSDIDLYTTSIEGSITLLTEGIVSPITLRTEGDALGGIEPDIDIQTAGDGADITLQTTGSISPVNIVTDSDDSDVNILGGNDTSVHAGSAAGSTDTDLNLVASGGTGTGRINIGVDTVVAPVTGNVQIKSGDDPAGGGSGGDVIVQSPMGKIDLHSSTDDVDIRAPSGAVDIDGSGVQIDAGVLIANGITDAQLKSSSGDVLVLADDDVSVRADGSSGRPNIGFQHGSLGSGLIVFCQPVLECFIRDEDLTSYTFPASWAAPSNHAEDTLGLGASDVAQWYFKLPFGTQINQVKVFLSLGVNGADISFSLMQHVVGSTDAQEIVGGADGTITADTTGDVDVMLEGDGATPNVAVKYDAGDGVWDSEFTKRLKDNTGTVESRSSGSDTDDDVWFESRYSLTISCSATQTATIKRIEVACWSKAEYP